MLKCFFYNNVKKGSLTWNALSKLYRFGYDREWFLKPFFNIKQHFMLSKIHKRKVFDLNKYERRIYSQNGEDGIIAAIFAKIGTTNTFFVEFGVEDGNECNTRLLNKKGGDGLQMDLAGDNKKVMRERVTAENIESLFNKYAVPKSFDLLSIDIDGNDYYVWNAIKKYDPRVVIIEYNSNYGLNETRIQKYNKNQTDWIGHEQYGCSLKLLTELGWVKGYSLVACDSKGCNAFFIKKRIARRYFSKRTEGELYRPPGFGPIKNGRRVGHKKKW